MSRKHIIKKTCFTNTVEHSHETYLINYKRWLENNNINRFDHIRVTRMPTREELRESGILLYPNMNRFVGLTCKIEHVGHSGLLLRALGFSEYGNRIFPYHCLRTLNQIGSVSLIRDGDIDSVIRSYMADRHAWNDIIN